MGTGCFYILRRAKVLASSRRALEEMRLTPVALTRYSNQSIKGPHRATHQQGLPPLFIVVVSPCRCELLRAGCCGGEGVLSVS